MAGLCCLLEIISAPLRLCGKIKSPLLWKYRPLCIFFTEHTIKYKILRSTNKVSPFINLKKQTNHENQFNQRVG